MKKQILFLIIGGLLIFVLGAGAGLLILSGYYKSQSAVPITTAINSLSSRMIPPVNASGQVKEIDNKNIIISSKGEDLSVKLADDSQFFAYSEIGFAEPAKINQIKVGDSVNISLKLLPDGTLSGSSISVFPQAIVKTPNP